MTKPTSRKPVSQESLATPFTFALTSHQEQAMQIFARHCEMISRYYQALARAQGPEGILAANAILAADAFEGFNELTALPAMLNRHEKEIRA